MINKAGIKTIFFLISLLFWCIGIYGQETYGGKEDSTAVRPVPESLKNILSEIVKSKEPESNSTDVEIDGLLIDETKTKTGRDFFDFFYTKWEAPVNAKNFSIYIKENPYRLNTTQIEVIINEIPVFQSFLQPRSDLAENLADYAVERTKLYLLNYEDLMRQLDGEDKAGTGIY